MPKNDAKKICKMNVVSVNGRSEPECTACGHRFDTDHAENPYREMCRIATGKFKFCPNCGAKYAGCQIEDVDLERCAPEKRDWILRGSE